MIGVTLAIRRTGRRYRIDWRSEDDVSNIPAGYRTKELIALKDNA